MKQQNHNNNSIESYTLYEQWVRRLYTTNVFHPVKLGLQNMERLHTLLGSPMNNNNDITILHVAGTNGKGSVCYKLAKVLELAGYKTGLFCSPHISSFRERMQINSQPISEDEVVQYLPHIYHLCQEHDIPATFFEITTALAFDYFAKSYCQVVVLETGLGGRLDATNVVAHPAVSIITSIGLEHTKILGNTVTDIAREKAGILKPACPVVLGPHAIPKRVFHDVAKEKGAGPVFTVHPLSGALVLQSSLSEDDTTNQDSLLQQDQQLQDYDLENSHIAAAALQVLQQTQPNKFPTLILTPQVIQAGLAQRPPCRFEQLQVQVPVRTNASPEQQQQQQQRTVQVILDVAHNPPAMEYLVSKLRRTYPQQQQQEFRMVVGMSADKNVQACFTALLQGVVNGDASKLHLVQAAHPRAASIEEMIAAFPTTTTTSSTSSTSTSNGPHCDLQDRSITKQVQAALTLAAEKNEILIVCGSVFVMAEAREALGMDEPRDSACIAQVAGAGFRHGQENFANSTSTTTTSTSKTSISSTN